MHILIAPNAFKNSISAADAATLIGQGLQSSCLSFTSTRFPIGDGGDGTAALLLQKLNGTRVACFVHDPLGRMIESSFGLIENGRTAIIEMADAAGLRLLATQELNPLLASSFGTGEMILSALDKGVTKIILGLGGSATIDGGTGILKALGIRFLDAAGEDLKNLPETLDSLSGIDITAIDPRLTHCSFIILCDVDNKLLGDEGAAAIFGPQKGASPNDILLLEKGLARFAMVFKQRTGRDISSTPHGGAAGGTAAGLSAFLDTRLLNGIDAFLEMTGFEKELEKSDLLITGEGSLDEQTLQGKGPYGVALRAKEKNIPVIGLAGKVPLQENNALKKYFDVLVSIGNEPTSLSNAIEHSKDNLKRISKEIGNLLSIGIHGH